MNKRKITPIFLTLLMLASLIHSSEAKMKKKCISFPGRRMIINSANVNGRRCITDGFTIDCENEFERDTVKKVQIFQRKISTNQYLYINATGKETEVTSNCGQLGIKYTRNIDIQLPGFEKASPATDVTCSGFIGRNQKFKANCTAEQVNVCYVDGKQVSPALWTPPPSPCVSLPCNLCVNWVDIELDLEGQFRK